MVELLRPVRGGFLRPFGCGWFIREFLLGKGPYGSPKIDPDIGSPQADIFHHYKMSLMRTTALDRATRVEEKRARRDKRPITPTTSTGLPRDIWPAWLTRHRAAVPTALSLTSQLPRSWAGLNSQAGKSLQPFRSITQGASPASISGSLKLG